MKDAVTIVVGILSAITLAIGLLGLAVRMVLVPWLEKHVIAPVKETNHQVTVNKHTSDPPTLLDKVDRVQDKVDKVEADVRSAARMFEGHIDLSADDRRELWEAIDQIIDQIRKDNRS